MIKGCHYKATFFFMPLFAAKKVAQKPRGDKFSEIGQAPAEG